MFAKKFATIVEHLTRNGKLIQTDNGLWNTHVEEELKAFTDKKEHISQVVVKIVKKVHKQNQAIKNKNIYKLIVLVKKEIGSENLETIDLVDKPTEVSAVETTSEQIETIVENQPPTRARERFPKSKTG
ncbi:hypothetical protein [Bartonella sp. MR30HLJHH]|uniref:hypothetical protein n=1 Tax=Bartonella sp. MR30HLJHH TaxID=3243557 RepID=UPI0035CF210B